MTNSVLQPVSLALVLLIFASSRAEDNKLTEKERADGWQLLVNGRDHTGHETARSVCTTRRDSTRCRVRQAPTP